MKKRLLVITRDEKESDNNKELFCKSLNFCKELVYNNDLTYCQLANMKYNNGLISQMLKTYLNGSDKHAIGIVNSPENYTEFKSFENSIYMQAPHTIEKKIIKGTNIICTTCDRPTSNIKLIGKTVFADDLNFFISNFEYIVLHHGCEELIYYFSALNHLLLNDTDNSIPLKKLILVNQNGIFNDILRQYRHLIVSGIDIHCISDKILQVSNIEDCLTQIQETKIYPPINNQFTIDE